MATLHQYVLHLLAPRPDLKAKQLLRHDQERLKAGQEDMFQLLLHQVTNLSAQGSMRALKDSRYHDMQHDLPSYSRG